MRDLGLLVVLGGSPSSKTLVLNLKNISSLILWAKTPSNYFTYTSLLGLGRSANRCSTTAHFRPASLHACSCIRVCTCMCVYIRIYVHAPTASLEPSPPSWPNLEHQPQAPAPSYAIGLVGSHGPIPSLCCSHIRSTSTLKESSPPSRDQHVLSSDSSVACSCNSHAGLLVSVRRERRG
jgi:hypothetical protein